MTINDLLKQVREQERFAQFSQTPPVPWYRLRYQYVLWQPPATKTNPNPQWTLRKDLNV